MRRKRQKGRGPTLDEWLNSELKNPRFREGYDRADMELRVAMEEFHKRIPEYELAEGTEVHFSPGIRQAENLHLVFPTK